MGNTNDYQLNTNVWCGITADAYQNCLNSHMSTGEFVVPAGPHTVAVTMRPGVASEYILTLYLLYPNGLIFIIRKPVQYSQHHLLQDRELLPILIHEKGEGLKRGGGGCPVCILVRSLCASCKSSSVSILCVHIYFEWFEWALQ
jgi:hypothetical protein